MWVKLLTRSRRDEVTYFAGGGSWARVDPSVHYLDLVETEVEGDGLYIRLAMKLKVGGKWSEKGRVEYGVEERGG